MCARRQPCEVLACHPSSNTRPIVGSGCILVFPFQLPIRPLPRPQIPNSPHGFERAGNRRETVHLPWSFLSFEAQASRFHSLPFVVLLPPFYNFTPKQITNVSNSTHPVIHDSCDSRVDSFQFVPLLVAFLPPYPPLPTLPHPSSLVSTSLLLAKPTRTATRSTRPSSLSS